MYAIAAYSVQCLVAGCRGSGAGQQVVSPGRGMLHDWHCQVHIKYFSVILLLILEVKQK